MADHLIPTPSIQNAAGIRDEYAGTNQTSVGVFNAVIPGGSELKKDTWMLWNLMLNAAGHHVHWADLDKLIAITRQQWSCWRPDETREHDKVFQGIGCNWFFADLTLCISAAGARGPTVM